METESVEESVSLAIQLEEGGQIKDAYFSFASLSQSILQSLTEVKFVHSSIVSSPKQHALLVSVLKTCLNHIENIIESHSVKTVSRQTTGETKGPPPPLPPKPLRIQKPSIPPKPNRVAKPPAVPRPPSPEKKEKVLPQDIVKPRVSVGRPTSLPLSQGGVSGSMCPARPQTEYGLGLEHYGSAVPIVGEGEVDPNYLVPAQTSTGDSLTPASVSLMNTDHVPLIPAPPLLTTHRELQERLDGLEEKVKQCRAQKQRVLQGRADSLETMAESSLDGMMAQYLRLMAETKVTLNGVRTIYMSAATVPSVLQFGAPIMAYQLTLIESCIFKAIPPESLLTHSHKQPHPRIVASTDFFNYTTRLIEHSILLPQDASVRAQLVHYWVKVASRCLDVNNYQTLKAIVSALSTPPVQRLKRTWSYIPKKSLVKLEALTGLMSEADNYGAYREQMGMVSTTVVNGKSVQQIRDEHYARPTVPFLGTLMHDMTYLLAAYKTHPTFARPEQEPRIAEVLTMMRRFQQGPAYTSQLPATKPRHYFRPALSNALHRGASRIQRFSGGNLFGFDAGSPQQPLSEEEEETTGSLDEQRMATQYILMRPWVSQNTVDELSLLREPPQPKPLATPPIHRTSSSNIHHRSSSIFSNSSTNLRFSTGSLYLADQNNNRPDSQEGSP